jgi:hypothetical protein
MNHSTIIYCNGCDDVGEQIQANLIGPDDSLTVTLHKNPHTGNYASNFTKICNTNCLPEYFQTSVGQTISIEAPGYTNSTATVVKAANNLDTPPYNVNAQSIAPNDPNVCNNYGGDSDGDKICDHWENNTSYPSSCPGPGLCIRTSETAKTYFLECVENSTHWSTVCPSPYKPDFFIEIDYMEGHKPADATISAVSDAFANSNYIYNGSRGITFHAQLDEELPHVISIPYKGTDTVPGFNQLKYWWFGTFDERTYKVPNENTTSDWLNNGNDFESQRSEKGQVFHYAIFAHKLSAGETESNSSGAAEQWGNDAIITLGSFIGMVGTSDDQQGTLLHEIGHNINLDHGGNDSKNCKPNYVSVMSYSLQFPVYSVNRTLDFSRSLLAPLNETALDENVGVEKIGSERDIAYGPIPGRSSPTGVPIDWNRNGEDTDDPALPPIEPDLTNFNIPTCMTSPNDFLTGFKDWNHNSIILTALGSAGNDQTDPHVPFDPNTKAFGGMGENVKFNELTSDDVIEMHVQRIDSILSDLNKIPATDFIGNAASIRESYTTDLSQIKTLIRQNIEGNLTMNKAYENLDNLFLKLDGIGNDDIIKTSSEYYPSIRDLVSEVVISQSHSLGGAKDYLNLEREVNKRPLVIPSPHPLEPIDSPLKQWNDPKIPLEELICNDGLILSFKPEDNFTANNNPVTKDGKWQPFCTTPDTKSKLIKRGIQLKPLGL